MKQTKKIVLIIIALIVVGVVLWMWLGRGPKHVVTYETAKVTIGNISSTFDATGTVEPVTQVEVGTQVSGIVNSIYVDYNSEVTKGQIIAELDKVNLLNELSSAQSNLASAKTQFEYEEKNYNRAKTLHSKELMADSEFESAWYSYETAKNAYNVSKNNVAKAQTNLGYATITSPVDGVVLNRAVEEGQTVASSFSTPTLFTIANDLTNMRVIADVDEAEIGGVEEGQRATFYVDAYPNLIFEGIVTQVRQEATTTNNVVTYEVVISAPNPDLKLKPGLTANVTFFTLDKQNVLSVPRKALNFSPVKPLIGDEDEVVDVEAEHKVWTREGNAFKAHPVQVGISNGILTEITDGLTQGMEVITGVTVGVMPGNDSTAGNGGSQETSPFMPQRPGAKK